MLQIIGHYCGEMFRSLAVDDGCKAFTEHTIRLTSKEARQLAANISIAADEADDHGLFTLGLLQQPTMFSFLVKGCVDNENQM
jgi:hypothetical protein